MAESQKESTSAAGSKKKSSSLDEDFGKDFLSSWKSSKVGTDMDFDVETVQQNGKKSFNFNKLEDFEFGGDFDKLSSFKVDMSDLDFCPPMQKTGNTNENTGKEFALGKPESRKDKFSFTFDFDELDKFDLGSELLEAEKKTNSCKDDTGSDNSVKHDKHLDSKSYSTRSVHTVKSNETTIFPNTDGMATSRPAQLGEADMVNTFGPPTSDLQCHVSSEAHTSIEKQFFTKEEKKDEIFNTEYGKQADGNHGTCLTKTSAEKAAQNFALLSVSGDGSVQRRLPQGQIDILSGISFKVNSPMEQDSGIRSTDSSQSRSSSTLNSLSPRQSMPKDKTNSPNMRGDIQKHEVNPNDVIGEESTSRSKSIQVHKVEKAHLTNDGEKESSLNLLSSLHRFSNAVSNKEKGTSSIQLKPLNMGADSSSQQTQALMSKQLFGFQSKKVEAIDLHLANTKRDANQNNKQIENQKGGLLKLKDKTEKKGVSFFEGSARNIDKGSDMSSFQLHPSNLCTPTAANISHKSVAPNLISGHAPVESTKIDFFAGQCGTPKDDRKHDSSSLTVLRTEKVECSTQLPKMHNETKLVRFSERHLGFTLNPACESTNYAITKKFPLLSPPLKRKTLEESVTELKNLNPLKRVTDPSTERRKSVEDSPKFDRGMVPGTENPEASDTNICVDNLISSNNVCEVGRMKEWEIPVLIEDDGNVEKAEACAKELDDICNMLKKKNDEAKELLVRAIVNNNRLLMLNHPILDEKIHALERFAASLRSKEYW